IYAPDVPETQRLFVSLAVGQSPLSGRFRANFTGGTGDAQLQKNDNRTKEKLAGATFGLYDAKDNLLKQGVTDENGQWNVTDLIFGDYYFMELAAPRGYELDETKLPFTINALQDYVAVSMVNEPKKVPFQFVKVDAETKLPMKGVTFVLYRCDVKHPHYDMQDDKNKACWQTVVGTQISGGDGKIDFSDLYAGDYQLVETKTVSGYAKPRGQWRVKIDPEGNETVIITIKGAAPAFTKDSDVLRVSNQKNYKLPFTGGSGVYRSVLMLAGIALILLAGILALVMEKRKSKYFEKNSEEKKDEQRK
ncbi:MAG: SpaA isopeptide-forming pilin-related protein, partial [Eubacterium sp.]